MKALVVAVATPAVLVLLIGAGMSGAAPAADQAAASAAPLDYPQGAPPAPPAFPGGPSGCVVPDPTGTGGCVTHATAWLLDVVEAAFGPLPTSCWDEHAWNPTSDHPRGKGCDYTFGRIGAFPGDADTARGWLLAEWLRANARHLAVSYVIWQALIWSPGRSDEGWRTYTGGGVYDAADPTGGHYDHIHVSLTH